MSKDAAKPANRKPPFDPKAFLLRVNGARTIAKYREHQIVYRQGDTADAVFYIQVGKAKVTVLSEQGKEAVVAVLGPGDFFGEGCLAGQSIRMGTATAITASAVLVIEKKEMIR